MEVLTTDTISPVKRQRSPSVEDKSPPAKKMKLANNEILTSQPNEHNTQNLQNNVTTPSQTLNNTSSKESAINTVKQLQIRKQELETKLENINKRLQEVNNAIEKKTDARNKKNREIEEKKKKATPKPKTPPKTKTQTKKSTQRPKRKRKNSDGSLSTSSLSPPLESCKSLITSVSRHKFAFPFMEPVDPVLLKIPDYFNVIKHPMDFGTIRNKLMAGEYESVADFNTDAQLVFSNACTYNHPGSDVYVMADTLRTFFNKKLKPIEEREKKYKVKQEGGLQELSHSVNTIKNEIEQIKTKKKSSPKTLKAKPSLEQVPMTKADMRKLSSAINSLSYKHLNTIITIIRQSMPNISGDGEIEIDLHSLDTQTLRKLETFVNSIKKKKSRKKEQLSVDAQRELARRSQEGTEKEIEAVQRQIEELRDPNHPPKNVSKKNNNTTPQPPSVTTPIPIQTPVSISSDAQMDESSSDSDSCSESESSESESDTESDPTETKV